jgi:hypothetical protein
VRVVDRTDRSNNYAGSAPHQALRAANDLLAARCIDDALRAFDYAASAGCEPNECAAGRWFCWMLLGDFARAWQESDLISASGAPDGYRLWDGGPFEHQRVVIRCLHGYGDAIQFIRYAPMVRRAARRVIVETHPQMVALLQTACGVDEVVAWGGADNPRRWDQQIEVMEFARAFGTTIDSIPCQIPYLHLPKAIVAKPRQVIDSTIQRKIGLVWASSDYNPARSIPLHALLHAVEPGSFYLCSLQHGSDREQLAGVPPVYKVHDLAPLTPDIIDTAAIIINLDLVITVDTLAAHLAGALGRPVWLMLPYAADWRWMLGRSDSPWYPTMRIFRQSSPDNWTQVIDQIAAALKS